MEENSWETPSVVWRRWVLLAAAHEVLHREGCRLFEDAAGPVAHLDGEGGWVRMRLVGEQRALVWARFDGTPIDEDTLFDETPDWAVDSETAAGLAAAGVTILVWATRNHWSSLAPNGSESLRSAMWLLTSDEGLVEWWETSAPGAPIDSFRAALMAPETHSLADILQPDAAQAARAVMRRGQEESGVRISNAAHIYLREEVYSQMRSATEIGDRGHPKRPALLRQWLRVNDPQRPFQLAVYAGDPTWTASPDNTGLDAAASTSLLNVLRELRSTESDDESGAWLFAQVASEGRQATLSRAYDSWPSWFPGALRPNLGQLRAEMARRTPKWTPAWSAVLPR